jgi:hypothetical protein
VQSSGHGLRFRDGAWVMVSCERCKGGERSSNREEQRGGSGRGTGCGVGDVRRAGSWDAGGSLCTVVHLKEELGSIFVFSRKFVLSPPSPFPGCADTPLAVQGVISARATTPLRVRHTSFVLSFPSACFGRFRCPSPHTARVPACGHGGSFPGIPLSVGGRRGVRWRWGGLLSLRYGG